MASSYPFLSVAQKHNVSYEAVLAYAEWALGGYDASLKTGLLMMPAAACEALDKVCWCPIEQRHLIPWLDPVH